VIYNYSVERSHRKSIAIIISAENKITVRCPWHTQQPEIEKFLESKRSWIERVVTVNSLKLAANNDVLEFKKIYLNGETLPLVFSDKNRITDGAVYIKSKKDIEKLYVAHCFESFKNRVREWSERAKLTPNSVSVKDYKSRWGCCDAKNNIIFNYKLFMLPPRVQEYVIVHELCHTLCHNHSPAFWQLVTECMPDCKQLRAQLKNYDFLTTLY